VINLVSIVTSWYRLVLIKIKSKFQQTPRMVMRMKMNWHLKIV